MTNVGNSTTTYDSMFAHALGTMRLEDCLSFPVGKRQGAIGQKGLQSGDKRSRANSQVWSQWPSAMIGLPTGRTSGIDVLDNDVKDDEFVNGYDFISDWQKRSRVIVRTPRGGAHLYFKSNGKVRLC